MQEQLITLTGRELLVSVQLLQSNTATTIPYRHKLLGH